MPPRRSHKKSKAGCQRCKNRKIKCDEVHPRCGNCSKHGVSCDFESDSPDPSLTPTPNGNVVPESPSSFSATSPASNYMTSNSSSSVMVSFYRSPTEVIRSNANPLAVRNLELKLMHHFTAHTSTTFSASKAQRVAWQMDIPAMAYDAPYLMDAILAVSAVHLRALHPEDQSLVRASHGYMASALSQYSSLLRNGVTEQNAEALFATAALIAFQSSASRRFDNPDNGNNYALPLSWFHSFQGVKTVVMTSWQWLRNSSRVYPIIGGQPALSLNLDHDRNSFFAPLLAGMDEQIANEPEYQRMEIQRSYEHSVAYLNWAHQRPHRERILGFAATVPRRFIDLIALQDPRALVILACFFALTRVVDDVWWLHGVAKREVHGIFSLLPHEWRGKMEWPIRIANHEGAMSDDVWGVAWDGYPHSEINSADEDIKAHIDMLAEVMNRVAPPMPPD